jgi:hypothetical protein
MPFGASRRGLRLHTFAREPRRVRVEGRKHGLPQDHGGEAVAKSEEPDLHLVPIPDIDRVAGAATLPIDSDLVSIPDIDDNRNRADFKDIAMMSAVGKASPVPSAGDGVELTFCQLERLGKQFLGHIVVHSFANDRMR